MHFVKALQKCVVRKRELMIKVPYFCLSLDIHSGDPCSNRAEVIKMAILTT